MNNAAGSKPMLDAAKQPVWNYTFQLESYTSADPTVKRRALAVAANSAYYIVLAGVIRRAMARRMAPSQQVTNALQAMELEPLQSFDDMSADGKALGKTLRIRGSIPMPGRRCPST